MGDCQVGLNPDLFAAAFPFHIILDSQLRVRQIGAVLHRICPGLRKGIRLCQRLRIIDPPIVPERTAMLQRLDSLFILEDTRTGLLLKGQVLHDAQNNLLYFLASPWVTDVSELSQWGLTVSDFAIHDHLVDCLFLLQTQKMTLQDLRKLAEKLDEQRVQLQQAHAELERKVAERTADLAQANAALQVSEERLRLVLEKVRHQFERLSALRAIDAAIVASLDLRVTLNILLDQVVSQLGVDATDILLLNMHNRTLGYFTGRGFQTPNVTHSLLWTGEGLGRMVAVEGCCLELPDPYSGIEINQRAPWVEEEGFVYYYAVPLIAKGQVRGALEIFHRTKLKPDAEWREYLEMLAGQAAIAIDNMTLLDNLQRSNAELVASYDTTLEGWVKALDLRDNETRGHTQRVTEMTLRLARALGVGEEELVHIRRGALLHDIGKIGIPDSILHKAGPLSEQEWAIMRKHPEYAYEWLSPIPYLRPALDIPYCHHEKWDGSGYPRGLKGKQIPLAARIFAVVDVWDALTSNRPYRKRWSEAEALEHIRSAAGTHFDPDVVEVFLRIVRADKPLDTESVYTVAA